MNKNDERQNRWNEAYKEGRGNILFYPNEEIIRFVNKYVRKRTGIEDFKDIMNLTEAEWKNFASLDLGCGIGRHIKYLDESGLNPYGIDLSGEAIREGKQWMCLMGKNYLADRLTVGSVMELPYNDDFFNISVSHGVLDSMPRSIAEKGLEETYRVLKKGGLMYFDFYMDTVKGEDHEEVVQTGFAKNTIVSYFTIDGVKNFLTRSNKVDIVELRAVRVVDENGEDIKDTSRICAVVRKK